MVPPLALSEGDRNRRGSEPLDRNSVGYLAAVRGRFGIFGGFGVAPVLTDGGDDAAVLVLGAIQGGQSCHSLGRNLMLGIQRREKNEPKTKGKTLWDTALLWVQKDTRTPPHPNPSNHRGFTSSFWSGTAVEV